MPHLYDEYDRTLTEETYMILIHEGYGFTYVNALLAESWQKSAYVGKEYLHAKACRCISTVCGLACFIMEIKGKLLNPCTNKASFNVNIYKT